MTADRTSEGLEIEAWANPTENLTFRFTAANNEATDVNGLKGWDTWIMGVPPLLIKKSRRFALRPSEPVARELESSSGFVTNE